MASKPFPLRGILITAILVAVGFMVLPKHLSFLNWDSSDPGDVVTVLVADRYIPAFTVIKPGLVRIQEFPKELVPPGSLHAKTELQSANGQMLFNSIVAIPTGQPVTRTLMTDAGQNDALGSLIQAGKVAVSFEVDRSHGVGGWIRPGDTVALFGPAPATFKDLRPAGKKTRIILPSVSVVAVDDKRLGQGKQAAHDAESSEFLDSLPTTGAKIVTVLVTPTEASQIIEAREEGNLSVVLRSLGDDHPWPERL